MNRTELQARIAEASPLRFTPAGLPALNLVLEHSSELSEAGQIRQIKLMIKAVVLGSLAETVARQAIGSEWRFTGFLATPLNGKHPVFHIQDIQSNTH